MVGLSLWTNYPGFTMFYAHPETDGGGQMLDFPGSNYLWLAPLMADPYNAVKVSLGGGGINGGAHLVELTATPSGLVYTELPYDFTQESGERISAMAFSPIDPSYRYVLTTGGHFLAVQMMGTLGTFLKALQDQNHTTSTEQLSILQGSAG